MAQGKQRQALAVRARLSPQMLPGYTAGETAALENEAQRIVAEDMSKRSMEGRASGHIVVDAGHLSGFVRDAHTTVRFAGGSVAVTTHD